MDLFDKYFSIQIFFIILRETIETGIIISVLLSFIEQQFKFKEGVNDEQREEDERKNEEVKKKMKRQVFVGAGLGLSVCLILGSIFIAAFNFLGKDYWSYTERIWEGAFSILSSVIITVVGIGLLRVNKNLKQKWWIKLRGAYQSNAEETSSIDGEEGQRLAKKNKAKSLKKRYFLTILPLVTTLREGLEAIVFVGGIGVTLPPSSFPLAIATGLGFGIVISWLLYGGGNRLSLKLFLIILTCFLYVVSAGLMSRGVWFFELERFVRLCGGLDVSETGNGPGSYDVTNTVWHVNCCSGLTDGWWTVLNAIFGWTNSATYGSVISYTLYWLTTIAMLKIKLYEEKTGLYPFIPVKYQLKRVRKKVAHIQALNMHKGQYQSTLADSFATGLLSLSPNPVATDERGELLTNSAS